MKRQTFELEGIIIIPKYIFHTEKNELNVFFSVIRFIEKKGVFIFSPGPGARGPAPPRSECPPDPGPPTRWTFHAKQEAPLRAQSICHATNPNFNVALLQSKSHILSLSGQIWWNLQGCLKHWKYEEEAQNGINI